MTPPAARQEDLLPSPSCAFGVIPHRELAQHGIGLGVWVDTEQAWLAVWRLDGQGNDLTENLALGDDWVRELDEEGYRYSRDDLARLSNDGYCIPLDRAAQRALQELGRCLGGEAP